MRMAFMAVGLLTSCTFDFKERIWEGKNPGECGDAADNDGDGQYDCDDPDCANTLDCGGTGESDCGDGLDNDGNGLSDCDDPSCNFDPNCSGGGLESDCDDGIDTFVIPKGDD